MLQEKFHWGIAFCLDYFFLKVNADEICAFSRKKEKKMKILLHTSKKKFNS